MATRTLHVPITGDAKDFTRAVKTADKDLDHLEKSGRKSLGSLKTGMLAVGAAATAGVVVGLKKSADAAIEAETANARLQTQLKALGISYAAHAKQIQQVIDKTSLLSGLDDEDLGDAFTNIVRVTGDVNKALNLTGLAADFARAKHMDVAKAGELVGKVAGGNTGILGRYGIQIDKGATATEALGILQQKFAGQAEAYGKTTAGAADRSQVAFENLGETIGAHVTPIIARVAEGFTTLVRQMTLGEGPGGRIRAVFEGIAGTAVSVYTSLRGLINGFRDGEVGARALAATLAGVAAGFVAFKTLGTIIAGVEGLTKAWAVLTTTIARNPIGLLAVVLSGVAAALITMGINTRRTTIDARDFNDAMRAQADALRAVRDIDIDVSQRRATLQSATVAVSQAEARLKAVRKDGNSTTLDVKQAEADLRQARVSQRRAQRDLNDVEEDSRRKRDSLTEATGKVRGEQNAYNRSIDRTIAQKEGELKSLTASAGKYGTLRSRVGSTRDTMEKAREKAEKLREEIASLKSKKINVGINLELVANDPSLRLTKKNPATGDGLGVGSAIRSMVKQKAASGGLSFVGGGGGSSDLKGARPSLGPFAAIGARFGLSVSSGRRPGSITSSGNVSYHSSGEAIDESGSASGMLGFFRFMKAAFGSRLAELIHTPGGVGIKDGRPYTYTGQVAADHYDHVHVAFDTGAPGVGDGHGRRPRTGDGLGKFVSTSYGPPWGGIQGTGTTATGVDLHDNPHTYGIAVDPSKLKLGKSYYVWPNPFGYHGKFKAFDTGGAIKGNRIDFYDWRGRSKQMGWGRRTVEISTTGPAKDAKKTKGGKPFTLGGKLGASNLYGGTGKGKVGASASMGMFGSAAKSPAILGPDAAELDAPNPLDYLNAAAANATLTASSADDIAAATNLRNYYQKAYDRARKTADPRDDIEAAQNLKAAIDALAQFAGDSTSLADALKALKDEMKQTRDFATSVQNTESNVLKRMLADLLSGQLAGPGVASRRLTPGYGVQWRY